MRSQKNSQEEFSETVRIGDVFNAVSAVVAGIIGNAVVDAFSRKNGYYTGSQSRTLPRLQTADEASRKTFTGIEN